MRSGGSSVGRRGGSSRLFDGRKAIRRRSSSRHWVSSSAAKWATPLVLLCTPAPPRPSKSITSWVTVLTTSGPVTNMNDVPWTMNVKSVMAGEYTAPPAHGPITAEICGITPDAMTLRRKISA